MQVKSMKKSWVSLLVVVVMLLCNTLPAFAANTVTIASPSTPYNATTDVTLTVTAEMLGADVVVSVPSEISIGAGDARTEYPGTFGNVTKDNFGATRTITMRGIFEESKTLYVGVDTTTELTNSENSQIKVPCSAFLLNGTPPVATSSQATASGKQIMYMGIDNAKVANSCTREVDFRVLKDDIMSIGTYTGTVNYYIALMPGGDSEGYLALF